jgi:hypothetical protein
MKLARSVRRTARGVDHLRIGPQLTDRNQDPGNQDKRYAQDHEVPQRKLCAPLRLFGKTEPGLATS